MNPSVNPALETLMLALSPEYGQKASAKTLFLGAEPHPALPPLITAWQPLKAKADACDAAGLNRCNDIPIERFPLVLILPEKSRDETLASFALAWDHLSPGGSIICSIPNTAGAGRFEKELAKATGHVTSISKNKCRAFIATHDDSWNESLFREWLNLADPQLIPNTTFFTQAGVFSSDHIDPGSQLLAEHLPKNLRGIIADLGAGWGFLSLSAIQKNPHIERIDLYESDARALHCARINLTSLRPETLPMSYQTCLIKNDAITHFHWHDVTQGISETYDAILMNPPFHIGRATHLDLGKSFITVAANALRRGGNLFIVANRQLAYECLLDSLELSWRKPAENATYKLLFAQKR